MEFVKTYITLTFHTRYAGLLLQFKSHTAQLNRLLLQWLYIHNFTIATQASQNRNAYYIYIDHLRPLPENSLFPISLTSKYMRAGGPLFIREFTKFYSQLRGKNAVEIYKFKSSTSEKLAKWAF